MEKSPKIMLRERSLPEKSLHHAIQFTDILEEAHLIYGGKKNQIRCASTEMEMKTDW